MASVPLERIVLVATVALATGACAKLRKKRDDGDAAHGASQRSLAPHLSCLDLTDGVYDGGAPPLVHVDVKVLALDPATGDVEPAAGLPLGPAWLTGPTAWECSSHGGNPEPRCPPAWFEYVRPERAGEEIERRSTNVAETDAEGRARFCFAMTPHPDEADIVPFDPKRPAETASAPEIALRFTTVGIDEETGESFVQAPYAAYPRTTTDWLLPIVLPKCAVQAALTEECEGALHEAAAEAAGFVVPW